jgi:hypothetical protein
MGKVHPIPEVHANIIHIFRPVYTSLFATVFGGKDDIHNLGKVKNKWIYDTWTLIL